MDKDSRLLIKASLGGILAILVLQFLSIPPVFSLVIWGSIYGIGVLPIVKETFKRLNIDD